jgi:hypothetical protein
MVFVFVREVLKGLFNLLGMCYELVPKKCLCCDQHDVSSIKHLALFECLIITLPFILLMRILISHVLFDISRLLNVIYFES